MKKLIFILLIAICGTLNAQYTKLLDFDGATNGSFPWGSLISDGTYFYGMTKLGGTNNSGSIFKIMPNGTGYVKLIDFNGTNGKYPLGSLYSDGTFLYGFTFNGGLNNFGCLFKIMPDGTGYVKLIDFNSTNGRNPEGSLFSDGTFLYGSTSYGGTNDQGTLFKILPNGTGYVKLLDFTGTINGRIPQGSLISDGTFLYGITGKGGTNDMGTIFKIMPNGTGYVKLIDFLGTDNGSYPYCSLFSDGTFLYGTTSFGGANNIGTIFKIKPDGSGYVKLLDFNGATNGSSPRGSLISDGIFLYGMTESGGTNNQGTIFKIMPDGNGYVKLIDFNSETNANLPVGSLISDGTFLYGMTAGGGTNYMGTVFKFQHSTLGVNENDVPDGFTIYPNPGNGKFNIETSESEYSLTILNLHGDKVYSENILDRSSIILDLDLPSGFYFAKFQKGQKILTKKIVIL
jgi:uncharacterized repeat protein (TIGR03803 family)